jgi:hypothetical protein
MTGVRTYQRKGHTITSPFKLSEAQLDDIIELTLSNQGEAFVITCLKVDNQEFLRELRTELIDPEFLATVKALVEDRKKSKKS